MPYYNHSKLQQSHLHCITSMLPITISALYHVISNYPRLIATTCHERYQIAFVVPYAKHVALFHLLECLHYLVDIE